jgi:SAM-dependent methyltransferase
MAKEEFDHLADNYEQNISPWMRITGESIEFYAQSRIKWVAKELKKRDCMPHGILDFGCGVGLATPFLLEEFGSDCTVIGVDVSLDSLKVATSNYASRNVSFQSLDSYVPNQQVDLIYCNGVFHHIPLNERGRAIQFIHDSLRPGGFFALWENNPWNPIVKYNMSHAEIDRNAIPIIPPNAKNNVLTSGFELLMLRYCFVFPKFLKFLRFLEAPLSQIPIGAQYVLLSRKDSH